MDLTRVASWAANTPWAISQEKLRAIAIALAIRVNGVSAGPEQIRKAKSQKKKNCAMAVDAAGQRTALQNGAQAQSQSIVILPICGTICPRMHQIEDGSGGISCERVGRWLDQCNADSKVGGIVLDIDSPGGSSFGVSELAAKIRNVAASKPVLAVANHEACSAAYWLASAASEVGVTPSGIVGSVGVYMIHQCFARALQEEGIDTTMIQAGEFKLVGNPFAPLDKAAESRLQAWVNDTYERFVTNVATYRSKSRQHVEDQFGKGWILNSQAALQQGMVDRVGSFEDLVADFTGRVLSPVKSLAASAARQREIEIARARLNTGLQYREKEQQTEI